MKLRLVHQHETTRILCRKDERELRRHSLSSLHKILVVSEEEYCMQNPKSTEKTIATFSSETGVLFEKDRRKPEQVLLAGESAN